MGLGRLGLTAVAHVWLTWGAPVAKTPPAEAPPVLMPRAAAPTVPAAVPSAPPRAAAAASIAPPPAPAPPQVPDEEQPGTGQQAVPRPPGPSLRTSWGPAAQVQMGVPAPASGKPRGYLYKRWVFWVVAASLVAGTAAITYVVTRPPPTPYYGNAGTIPFP